MLLGLFIRLAHHCSIKIRYCKILFAIPYLMLLAQQSCTIYLAYQTMMLHFYAEILLLVNYFLRKQVLRTILLPSILQSTSSGLSVRRMLFTFVPLLITIEEPLTFKSLITVTASPSAKIAPLLSLATLLSSAPSSAVLH